MHGAIPPLPQYAFMAWCLDKHRDNFAFIITIFVVIIIIIKGSAIHVSGCIPRRKCSVIGV
jgi:hypothetical protein